MSRLRARRPTTIFSLAFLGLSVYAVGAIIWSDGDPLLGAIIMTPGVLMLILSVVSAAFAILRRLRPRPTDHASEEFDIERVH